MTPHTAPRSLILAPLILAPLFPLYAADNDPASRIKLEEPKNERLNRFSVSYGTAWNINANFTQNGGHIRNSQGAGPYDTANPANNRGVDRFYDDGYHRSDVNGNKDGLSWFWAYRNEGQVNVEADTISMHSTTVAPVKSKDASDDPQHGAQVKWNRELGHGKENKVRWGFEVGFGWSGLDIEDSRSLQGGARTITDTYNLGGVDPGDNIIPEGATEPDPVDFGPGKLYPGTYDGPGSLIDDLPNRTFDSNRRGALVTGTRTFEGNLWFMHLGPYVEFPIVKKLSAVVSGGLAVGCLHGEYSYNERSVVTAPGYTSPVITRSRGQDEDTQALVGGYISATLLYEIDTRWGIFVGGQFQSLGEYSSSTAGRKVEIDLSTTPFVTAGVSCSF